MLELKFMELILELPDGLVLSCHLQVDAARFFHHLIDNKLVIPSYLKASNPNLEGDLEPV
jgi:hypothetical protein